MKLRDMEVTNDDFERQARNTTSSLEDMESKQNQAIERAVMMEGEIKEGEQERETLRIETQRLKEELSDLKIEAELLQEKIRKQESRHLSVISTDVSVLESPVFDKNVENSPNSTASSPLVTTPPDTKITESISGLRDPPSPPMSDTSAPLPKAASAVKTPASTQRRSRIPSADQSVTPKPRKSFGPTPGRPARISSVTTATRTPAPGVKNRSASQKLPASNSLSHVRTLTAQMQRLEDRVLKARSRLPAPTHTPPRASPRSSAHGGGQGVPSSVTIRSRKRTTGSTASSSVTGDEVTPTNHHHHTGSKHMPRLSTSGVSRLSFGPLPNRHPGGDSDLSRPSSRASISSLARPASRTDMVPPPRPMSRTGGSRTPMSSRPRSSLGGSLHGHSASISGLDVDEADEDDLRTPSRRGTYSRFETDDAPASAIPMPGSRRQSAVGTAGRRTSTGPHVKETPRPASRSGRPASRSGRPSSRIGRPVGELGETY